MANGPISPPRERGGGRFELPAYLSNGVIGLRIPDVPMLDGWALVNGFTGEHPEAKVEAAALAPFPLGGDISLNGVSLTEAAHATKPIEQTYDFASGELTSTFLFTADGVRAEVTVLTFCSRADPAIVCQQLEIAVDQPCALVVTTAIVTPDVAGHASRVYKDLSGREAPIDGAMRWEAPGGPSSCGVAYMAKLETKAACERSLAGDPHVLRTSHKLSASAEHPYRWTQVAALVPSVMHRQPELQAARLVAMNAELGFEEMRARNEPSGTNCGRVASSWSAPTDGGKPWPTPHSSISTVQFTRLRPLRRRSSDWRPGKTITTITDT